MTNWNRKFVAIDGEALDGRYSLISASDGSYQYDSDRLSTEACIGFLRYLSTRNRGAYFVGYGIHYDVNMIFRDLCPPLKDGLFNAVQITRANGLTIKYLPKKLLDMRWLDGTKLVWFDALGFCQSSFVDAYSRITGKEAPDFVYAGKRERGTFKNSDFLTVLKYNRAECGLLVEMMEILDELLQSQGIRLRRWYGASCIADNLLSSIRAQDLAQYYYPQNLEHAMRCAYFGGRIEALKLGTFEAVSNYDINSAYPFAASNLPAIGEWRKINYLAYGQVAVYKIEWNTEEIIGPFPWRAKDGSIYFPRTGTGWYWSPEVEAAMLFSKTQIKILEGYISECDYSVRPFEKLIKDLYLKRSILKQEKNRAELVLKLGLNAMYGKLAQHSGRARYFNLAYAGLITSATRATLYGAALQYPEDIIGFATDAILCERNLDVPISPYLGQWSEGFYDKATVIMPGIYRLNGQLITKLRRRGFKNLDWNKCITDLNSSGSSDLEQNQFITWKIARNMPKAFGPKYLEFVKAKRTMCPLSLDKRHYHFSEIQDWNTDGAGSEILEGFPGESAEISWSAEKWEPEMESIYND